MQRLTSGDKVSIRTLKLFLDDSCVNTMKLRTIDTGSNKYTILCKNLAGGRIEYSVFKTKASGKHIGEIIINKVSRYGVEYNNTLGSLPDSVVKYIKLHYCALCDYIKLGEKAFDNY